MIDLYNKELKIYLPRYNKYTLVFICLKINDSSLGGLVHVYDIYQIRVNSPIDGRDCIQCLFANTVFR